jgi:hypothetical protein
LLGAVRQLDVSAEQRARIQAIIAGAKPRLDVLVTRQRQNRDALEAIAPTDPAYPALVAGAQVNAQVRAQMATDLRTRIHAVLTPLQQAQVPAILAADRTAREARLAASRPSTRAPESPTQPRRNPMNFRKLLIRAAMSLALGTGAPLVLAQAGPGGEMGGHGGRANNPQWQACKKQADEKNLARGAERKSFMQNCLKAGQNGSERKPQS